MSAELAILTPAFAKPSLTFIRRHIAELAPGRTVVFAFDDSGASGLDCEVSRISEPDRSALPWVARKPLAVWSHLSRGYSGALDGRQTAKLVQLLRASHVTVALAEYGWTGCTVGHACRRAGVPLFVHFHGADVSAWPNTVGRRRAYRKLGRSTSGLICPSRFLAQSLIGLGLPESKMHVVPYGVDVEQFSAAPDGPDEGLLLAVGRFVEKKAPRHVIESFALIARQRPGVRLEMVGDGLLLDGARRLARELGVADRVLFHGARAHAFVAERMQRAALLLQHSVTAADGDTEGLPVAILEGMASGLPVVSTRHSGIPEAVVEGETGLLVDEHDVAGMAAAIGELLDDPGRRRRMGEAGRRRAVEQFSAPLQIGRLRGLLGLARPGEGIDRPAQKA